MALRRHVASEGLHGLEVSAWGDGVSVPTEPIVLKAADGEDRVKLAVEGLVRPFTGDGVVARFLPLQRLKSMRAWVLVAQFVVLEGDAERCAKSQAHRFVPRHIRAH